MPAPTSPANPLAELLTDSPLTLSKYTESQRMTVLAVYAETGSARAASRLTGVPESTIRVWVEDEETATLILQLRSAIREKAAFEYLELVQLGQAATRKRLVEGDPHVTKDGELMFVPVKARDAMLITAMAHDKLTQLAGGLDGQRGAGAALANLAGRLVTQLERAQREATTKVVEQWTG